MRLGFHYHIPAITDGNGIRTPGYQGCFIEALARHCEEVVCFLHSPRSDETAGMDCPIRAKNVTLVDIGPHTSVPRRLLKAARFTRPLRSHRTDIDAMLIRGPSPLLPAMASAARPVPVSLLIVGDYQAGVDDLPQPAWRKSAIRAFAWWNARGQLRVARRSLTFVNSHLLYEKLQPKVPHLIETRTTTLTEADFFVREDTCLRRPFRLLYTGRMDRAKGLLDILEALAVLVHEGEDVVLDLVGPSSRGDPIMDEVDALARARGIHERVVYHGSKPLGQVLFSFYQNADLFVIASQSDFEGFPRVIWEAMAHSLPVVATSVGSIPAFCGDSVLLVPPKNVTALTDAVRRLLGCADLRRKMITSGRNLAKENTLDVRASDMVRRIENWIRDRC